MRVFWGNTGKLSMFELYIPRNQLYNFADNLCKHGLKYIRGLHQILPQVLSESERINLFPQAKFSDDP